ncbi:MAG: PilZ domain-containing protein [Porticoccus sp.]|nr:PilZ domain-containing protein [Porticoccus sp.]PCJ92028.1 MAG: pilus assembly protein PilZ [Porticoccaceae bacterium]
MDAFGGGVRNGILNLSIKDSQALYAAYMSFVQNGGLFIATRRTYMLGDEVFLLLDLIDEPERIPLTGKVIWVTPKGLGGSRREGVGIQLNEKHADIQTKFEAYLAGLIDGVKPTNTM